MVPSVTLLVLFFLSPISASAPEQSGQPGKNDGTKQPAAAGQRQQSESSSDDRVLKNYDVEYDSEEVMDETGAAKVKRQESQPFLRDIERLYARGFRRSHVLRSQSAKDGGMSNTVHRRRVDDLLTRDQIVPVDETQASPRMSNVVLAGRKAVNLSALPFLPKKPHLTVQAWDLEKDDKVSLYASVAFESQASFSWFLNGRRLDEYDSLQTVDMHTLNVDNKTYRTRVCLVEIEHLLKLPTRIGQYEINCTVSVDFSEETIGHVLTPQLTDDCPPANCYDRHALCKDGKCFCGTLYPVRLNSVHTTCRTESFLETPCHHHEQCLKTTNDSECLEQGWCACKRGYGRGPQQRCIVKIGIGARCDSDAECSAYNATCIVSHCTCSGGSVEENGYCGPKPQAGRSIQDSWAALHSAGTTPQRGSLFDLMLIALTAVAHVGYQWSTSKSG